MSPRIMFRSLSAVVSMALLITFAPAAVGSPARDAIAPASVSKDVTERPDRVSAMVTARTQGSRVEDVSARTPTTSTFANPDGTWTTESYAGIVRSKEDEDTWVPVDSSVEAGAGEFQPKATPYDAGFSDGGDKTVASITTPDGPKIDVGWPTKLPSPQVNGDHLTYQDAAGTGADLVVTSHPDGFNYSMVINHAPTAPLTFQVPLDFGGADPVVKADGSIVIKHGKHEVAVMSAPVMWDSTKPTNDKPVQRVPVSASVEGIGSTRTLVLKPNMDYLRDPSRVFPVVVDPTVALPVAGDTWVDSLFNTTGQGSSPELQVGSNSLGLYASRSFMYFDLSPLLSMPRGVMTSAQVQLSNFESGACPGTAIRMSRVLDAWTPFGLTWAHQPAVTSTGSTTSTTALGTNGCSGEGMVTFDATAMANAWFDPNGPAPMYGVRFSADNESASSGWRKYRSADYSDPSKAPKLIFTYNAYPSTPTGLTVSPGYNGYASSTTPTFSAVVSDPDNGPTRGYFEVKSGSTVVWSGSSPMATSGAQVQVTVPSGVLTDGTTYTVDAYSQDSSLKSESPQEKTFTVDTTAPTVAINSTNFTNGTWTTSTPSSASTLSLHGTPDTGWFYITYDGVPQGVASANASGDYAGSWSPSPGWHSLEVAALDRAGNRGPTSTFSFGSGAPQFTTPNTWTESTSSFPVEMSAPANSTGATLQWQLNGESTWHTATQVTSGGTAWNGTVSTANAHTSTPTLLWKAVGEPLGTATLAAPALVMIKGCFHYASASDSCTDAKPVILTTSARGGNFPEAQVGPASVALFSGEATISDTDAADSKAGLGRTFSAFSDSTLNAGLFGPGWSDPAILAAPTADAKAQVVDNRTKDGTFVIVDPDSGAQAFRLKQGSTTDYVPVQPTGDATKLTYTAANNGNPDMLELSRPLGSGAVVTTWTLKPSDNGGSPEWTFDKVTSPTSNDVAVTTAASSQRPVWIRESDPSASATCNMTTQTVGCRGLKITYTGTGASTRVGQVDRLIGAATQAGVVTKTLATYSYDASGKLTSVCSAAPAAGKPALCVNYAYTTVTGRILLSQITPPGLKPWRLSYDSIGRLTTVNREKPTGGDATWSVDYSLTTSSSGLPDLSASTASQWGQTVIPTKVFAVYEPFTGAADVTKAHLYYTTASGTTTNTATYGPSGWLVDTSWYDDKGNQVQHLDPTGWARVQAVPQAQRPAVAADASSYTIYNTWGGADVAGTRVVDEYGPVHTATLKSGTVGLYRTHTHTMYDDDPNVDPSLITATHGSSGLGLVVESVASTSNPARTTDDDAVITKYGYEPIVSGDGNGWTLGSPTTVSTQIDANTWSTQVTRYDTKGRQIETRQPGGAEDASHAGADAHSTKTTYYTATPGTGVCDGKPAWDGLVCKVEPAAQPTGPTIPTTYNADFNDDLQPTNVQETSSGTTRTTTTSYDALGRPTGITKSTTGSGATTETIATSYGYDDTTGLPTTTTSGTQTVTTGYDTWGRQTSYTDALGTPSATSYDAAGNVATFYDGSATYTYSYDAHRNLTGVDAGGGAGIFSYGYATNGNLDTVTYPNGMRAVRAYDQTGNQNGLTYSQGTTTLLSFAAAQTAEGRTISASSPASSQGFTYDGLGRLTKVQDTRSSGCVTRTYGFDASSNRSTSANYAPGTYGTCQSTTATATRSNAYDAAGRIRNNGYTYDTLGRTLTTPQTDAGANAAGPLSATYHADDMVATLSQSVLNGSGGTDARVMTYGLDPAERINTITTTTNSAETQRLRYRFADSGDSPTTIETSVNGGTTWTPTRYISIPGLGMAASSTAGTTTLQLANLHGDLVATMDATSGSTLINSYSESDEYGNAVTGPTGTRYAWLGVHQRSDDALGGVALMGARLYNPTTGMFLSVDPIPGGNATPYTYPQDPVNEVDLSGETTWWWGGYNYYDTDRWTPYTYIRIWINVNGLRNLQRAVSDIFGLIGARLGWSKAAKVVGGRLLAWVAVATIVAGYGIDWMDRNHYGLGYKLFLSKSWPTPYFPLGGYAYLSNYAWHEGM